MAKEVIWTLQATVNFNNVISYLEQDCSEKEVKAFIEATTRVISYITEHPAMFRQTNLTNIREALITPHNLLIYEITSSKIILLMIWDTRRNPKQKKYKKQ